MVTYLQLDLKIGEMVRIHNDSQGLMEPEIREIEVIDQEYLLDLFRLQVFTNVLAGDA